MSKKTTGKREVKYPRIQMLYSDFNKPGWTRFIDRAENAEVDSITACRLHQIVRIVKPLLVRIEEEYIEMIQKPMQLRIKDAMGLEPDAELPAQEDMAMADAETKEKLKVLNDEHGVLKKTFGEQTIELHVLPLAPQHLRDLKISVSEIEALGPLFDQTGDVRIDHFKKRLGIVPNDST